MELAGKTIAVTGATGFLGGYVALELLARGARVRGVVRSPEKGAWLGERGVAFARADLMDPKSLVRAFEGVDAIVSNAALYQLAPASFEEYVRTNREGIANVMNAAREAGVKRIVVVSTCGVYRVDVFGRIHEHSPRLRWRDRFLNWAYTVSKSLAEDVAWELADEHGQQLTVVRPSGVWGRRDEVNGPVYRWFLRWPVLPVPTVVFPMAHAADVAKGVVSALERDQAIGKAYNLVGPLVSMYRMFCALKVAAGHGPLLLPLPLPLGLRYDGGAAERELGYVNRPVEEAVYDVVVE